MPNFKQTFKLSARHQRRLVAREASIQLATFNSEITTLPFEADDTPICTSSEQLNAFKVPLELLESDFTSVESAPLKSPQRDQPKLKDSLAEWAVTHKITHCAINGLLNIISNSTEHENIPKDARTLLKTPRASLIRPCSPGQLLYLGLTASIKKHVSSEFNEDEVKIQVNVDGLPVHKSTNGQFWPVLISIINDKYPNKVFVTSVYYGTSKPASSSDFLQEFIDESITLYETGIEVNGRKRKFVIENFICDAPAKSFVANTKGHSGYFSCNKCIIKGNRMLGRTVFLSEDVQLRNDADFRAGVYTDHHVCKSELERIPINMITSFPHDYMHLICIGVVKKLLKLWLTGKNTTFKLPKNSVCALNHLIKSNRKRIPLDFARRPRSTDEVDRWKATEFRQFLLYTGPVFLESVLPKKYYQHFLCLHAAVTLLIRKVNNNQIDCAERLLKYFVHYFPVLYGEVNCSYNVHGLLHIANDCRSFGSLDKFGAFKFENKLGQIKSLLRKSSCHLQQIHRRLVEIDSKLTNSKNTQTLKRISTLLPEHLSDHEEPCYRKYSISPDLVVSTNGADNLCILSSGEIIKVDHIATNKFTKEVEIIGKTFTHKQCYYTYPVNSSRFGIFSVSQLSNLSSWPVNQVAGKGLLLIGNNSSCFLPIRHYENV